MLIECEHMQISQEYYSEVLNSEGNITEDGECVRFDAAFFFFSSRRRHTRYWRDWSSDVCSSDLAYDFAAVSLRYFNVAGAAHGLGERHTTETHLIPIALQVAAGQREVMTVYGEDYPTPDGTCIRDYIHVEDLSDAHLLALAAPEPGEHRVYNLGNGTGFSVQEVVDAVREVTGHPVPVEVGPRRAGDPAQLVAASDRIRTDLGWTPRRPDLTGIVQDAWDVAQKRA